MLHIVEVTLSNYNSVVEPVEVESSDAFQGRIWNVQLVVSVIVSWTYSSGFCIGNS